MLAAKDEKNAMGATLLFNIAHYALRPWPWILIALASLVVFPDLESIKAAFPGIEDNILKDDLAYSAMLTMLPSGLLGLVVASLIAAFMSTLSTHLNWGSSYIVHDFYKRFVKPDASEKEAVIVGRVSTVGLMALAALLALALSNAVQAFNILLQIGAGTGAIFILRWFWWRINAYSEISGMIISFLVAIYMEIIHVSVLGFDKIDDSVKLVTGVIITTIGWLIVTFMTQPTEQSVLANFYKKIRPASKGWQPVLAKMSDDMAIENKGQLPTQILGMFVGCITVYAALFATGYWIYGMTTSGLVSTVVAVIGTLALFRIFKKLG